MANPKRDWEHGWIHLRSHREWKHESGLSISEEVVAAGTLVPEHWLEESDPDDTYRPCSGVIIRRRGEQNGIYIAATCDLSKVVFMGKVGRRRLTVA